MACRAGHWEYLPVVGLTVAAQSMASATRAALELMILRNCFRRRLFMQARVVPAGGPHPRGVASPSTPCSPPQVERDGSGEERSGVLVQLPTTQILDRRLPMQRYRHLHHTAYHSTQLLLHHLTRRLLHHPTYHSTRQLL